MAKKKFQTKAKTPEGILKAAARFLRENGWSHGQPYSPTGGVDVTVAINRAIDSSTGYPENDGSIDTSYELWVESVALMKERVGISGGTPLFTWNDEPGRKFEDVIDALEGR